MNFKNWVKSVQTAGYDGVRKALAKIGKNDRPLAPLVPTVLWKTNSGGCRLIKGVVVLRLKANATYLLFRDALRNTTAFL